MEQNLITNLSIFSIFMLQCDRTSIVVCAISVVKENCSILLLLPHLSQLTLVFSAVYSRQCLMAGNGYALFNDLTPSLQDFSCSPCLISVFQPYPCQKYHGWTMFFGYDSTIWLTMVKQYGQPWLNNTKKHDSTMVFFGRDIHTFGCL